MAAVEKNKGKRESKGRRKIEIKKIENMNRLQVTFSKRRAGLFKKAGELSLLTGAEIAMFAQSSHGRVFTFGHPNADAVVERYLTGDVQKTKPTTGCGSCTGEDVKRHLEELEKLEAEKARLEEMNKEVVAKGMSNGGFWWERDVNGMGLEELEQFMKALKELKISVDKKVDEKAMARGSSIPPFLPLLQL
ncbi:unnamed protein product, partial [Ilex paraguariensis]